jgi:hypothetical protein
MRRALPLLVLVLLHFFPLHAQETWGIKDASGAMAERCGECLAGLERKPKEVQFGTFSDEEGTVWFVVTDAAYLAKLTEKGGYGFTVDVIARDQYRCGQPVDAEAFPRGVLLEPVYQAAFKLRSEALPTGGVALRIGTLPSHLRGVDCEFNLVILKNKYLCGKPTQHGPLGSAGVFSGYPSLLNPYRASSYARVSRLGYPENPSSSLPNTMLRWLLLQHLHQHPGLPLGPAEHGPVHGQPYLRHAGRHHAGGAEHGAGAAAGAALHHPL